MTDGEDATQTTRDAERNPHAESVLKLADAMLRYAIPPAAITLVGAAVVALLLEGVAGLLSALIGCAVAAGSSLATLWLMRRTAKLDPMLVMAVAMGGLMFKLLVLLGVMTTLGAIDGLHREALAFSMLAIILVWAGAEAFAFRRTKIPTIIPSSD